MRKLFFSMLKKVLFISIILILFTPEAKALGTLQKRSYLEIAPGQIAEFSILLWNSEPIEIEFREKVIPKDWIVMIEPKKFVLDNITSSEIISSQDGYVRALPVKIFAIVPKNANPGIYEITINMVAGKTERGISFFQEKNFNFKINVSSSMTERKESINESVSKPVSKTGDFTIPIEEIEKTEPVKLVFWSIVVLIFLVIGWVVYRL